MSSVQTVRRHDELTIVCKITIAQYLHNNTHYVQSSVLKTELHETINALSAELLFHRTTVTCQTASEHCMHLTLCSWDGSVSTNTKMTVTQWPLSAMISITRSLQSSS